jgi:hypothetical protein
VRRNFSRQNCLPRDPPIVVLQRHFEGLVLATIFVSETEAWDGHTAPPQGMPLGLLQIPPSAANLAHSRIPTQPSARNESPEPALHRRESDPQESRPKESASGERFRTRERKRPQSTTIGRVRLDVQGFYAQCDCPRPIGSREIRGNMQTAR